MRDETFLKTRLRLKTIGCLLIVGCLWVSLQQAATAATWSVASGNSLLLDSSSVNFDADEMSGVIYLGPGSSPGRHRFQAVQDSGAGLVTFDASFDLSGNLIAAQSISQLTLGIDRDYEGIAQVGERLFLSEEDSPGVREIDATTGNELQNVSIPALFTDNTRGNRGFESLAYDQLGTRLWTANEEALTVDGSLATPTEGTTVRLLELEINGNALTAGSQYAYEVDPIPGGVSDSTRSGLAELVSLPDGTLLALERSLAVAFPPYRNRVYEIDLTGATDISQAPFDAGLDGESYTAVGKTLLWSGAAGGGFGQNLEGLTVGPQLPSGDFILLGVVDGSDDDPLSENTIVTLIATPSTPIDLPDTGDLDHDGDIDGADFLGWQRGVGGKSLAAAGDGNYDGLVTDADLTLWQNALGASAALVQTVPEPSALAMLLLACVGGSAVRRRSSMSMSFGL